MTTILEAHWKLRKAVKHFIRERLYCIGLVPLEEYKSVLFELHITERERDYYRSVRQPRDAKGRFVKQCR